jgi:hypothetical protein
MERADAENDGIDARIGDHRGLFPGSFFKDGLLLLFSNEASRMPKEAIFGEFLSRMALIGLNGRFK